MKRNNFLICVILLCSFYTLRAELLIVQKNEEGRFALLPSDSGNHDEIQTILAHYQWPQCITYAANMTDQEKIDLLSPGKPYAEELFIQNKFQQAGKSYQVIFVPTTLYELFCILYIFEMQNQKNPLQEKIDAMISSKHSNHNWAIDLEIFINTDDSFTNIMKNIYTIYNWQNRPFFETGIWTSINNAFVQFLWKHYPDLAESRDAFIMSEKIEKISKKIAALLVAQLSELYEVTRNKGKKLFFSTHTEYKYEKENAVLLLDALPRLSNMIERVIDLEYEARKSNTALLLRGGSLAKSLGSKKKYVAHSTLIHKQTLKKKEKESPFKEPTDVDSMSISFGNSLFAGALRDKTASAYYFLLGGRQRDYVSPLVQRSVGYALFIDKKAYIEHRIHNLFFISPLMTLSGLLQKGEYFHSRTTAAISSKGKDDLKNSTSYSIKGLENEYLIDPSGVLLITRDPLRQAELFSQYLAQHGRVLQEGTLDMLTPEERQFAQEALKLHEDAAKFYEKMRKVVKPAVRKNVKHMRTRKQIERYIHTIRHYEHMFNKNARTKDVSFVIRKQREFHGILMDLESIKNQKIIKKTDLSLARRLVEQAGAIVQQIDPAYIIAIPEENDSDIKVQSAEQQVPKVPAVAGVEEEVKVKEGE